MVVLLPQRFIWLHNAYNPGTMDSPSNLPLFGLEVSQQLHLIAIVNQTRTGMWWSLPSMWIGSMADQYCRFIPQVSQTHECERRRPNRSLVSTHPITWGLNCSYLFQFQGSIPSKSVWWQKSRSVCFLMFCCILQCMQSRDGGCRLMRGGWLGRW